MIDSKIIFDSISPNGTRLTTFEVNFHRFVLPELNTHRVFSRNYPSSRAVPVEKMIKQVKENPAAPVHWGKNQTGMQAQEELTGEALNDAQHLWRVAAYDAAVTAKHMLDAGAHKQIVNRILEPFVWTKGIITATDFESFFKLRCHEMAQPEIRALAENMEEKYRSSTPEELTYGEWHLPYTSGEDRGVILSDNGELFNNIKVSTSCAAQVSYRKLNTTLERAESIYEKLNLPDGGDWPDDPPHFSPAEHCAMCVAPELQGQLFTEGLECSDIGGNFQAAEWYQYRKMLEQGVEHKYIQG